MKKTVRLTNFCGRLCVALCLIAVVVQPVFAFNDPPMRVARLNYVQGDVSFQPGGESDWGWAAVNRPMTTGDSLWTGDSSRAELHVGSTAIRVGPQTSVAFLTTRSFIAWPGLCATPDVCRAKSCMRHGRWRGEYGGCFAAGASSTWAPATACSPN